MSRLDGRVNYDGESRYRKVNYLYTSIPGMSTIAEYAEFILVLHGIITSRNSY